MPTPNPQKFMNFPRPYARIGKTHLNSVSILGRLSRTSEVHFFRGFKTCNAKDLSVRPRDFWHESADRTKMGTHVLQDGGGDCMNSPKPYARSCKTHINSVTTIRRKDSENCPMFRTMRNPVTPQRERFVFPPKGFLPWKVQMEQEWEQHTQSPPRLVILP